MDITIYPNKLHGDITAIPSKSHAHRLLICAAFSDAPTTLECQQTNQDIEATVGCLNALGAQISRTESGYHVIPVKSIPHSVEMDCCESGSTLRFLLPIVCALGVDTLIHMSGRLPDRPLSPLWEELERMGCCLSRPTNNTIQTTGKLSPGKYTIAGNISSQFISGLLFALSLLNSQSKVAITGKLESKPYVEITQKALDAFGIHSKDYIIDGGFPFHSPGNAAVEGDWSNASFFLVAKALANPVCVHNLNPNSYQGDRAVADILAMGADCPIISAADIPDLVPILAVYFAAKNGAVFTDVSRLRLKESDRIASIMHLLQSFGIQSVATEDTLTVYHGLFHGCTVNAFADHRIAMAAAIAATIADGPVTIIGAECVAKSYPAFWQEYQRLGGKYEQYIR